MKKKYSRGFTIVELVIVIAVIAVLAGVLIPTFASVVSKARESAELQDIKNEQKEQLVESILGTDAPNEPSDTPDEPLEVPSDEDVLAYYMRKNENYSDNCVIILRKDGTFSISPSIFASTVPRGTYKVTDGSLELTATNLAGVSGTVTCVYKFTFDTLDGEFPSKTICFDDSGNQIAYTNFKNGDEFIYTAEPKYFG